MKIRSVGFYVKLLTDKQTDKRRALGLHNVLGGRHNNELGCIQDLPALQSLFSDASSENESAQIINVHDTTIYISH